MIKSNIFHFVDLARISEERAANATAKQKVCCIVYSSVVYLNVLVKEGSKSLCL